jgi:aryl-alcohol dehydrogenase-like predicted oxidoreductase
VLARADNIVTIPGTTKLANLKSNMLAADVSLQPTQIERLNALAAKVKGDRYDEAGLKTVGG